jgi:hypothetical protein
VPSEEVVVDLRNPDRLDSPDVREFVINDTTKELTWPGDLKADAYSLRVVGMPNTALVEREPGETNFKFDLTEFRLPAGPEGTTATYNVIISARGRGFLDSEYSIVFGTFARFTITDPHPLAPHDLERKGNMLEWEPGNYEGDQTFRVESRRTGSGDAWLVRGTVADEEKFDLSTVTFTGGEYDVRVVAILDDGTTAPSYSVTLEFRQAIDMPTNISIDSEGVLRWTRVVGATGGYQVVINGTPLVTQPEWFESTTNTVSFDLTRAGLGGGLNNPGTMVSVQLRALGANQWIESGLTGIIWYIVPA